uniref:Skip-2 n=2 Tax=Solanum tuberosum TaxID=4113 RepID=M0ZUV9_SOLTU
MKRLHGITDGAVAEPIGPGVAGGSLRVICLKELYNGQCFGPLIIGSKSLRMLKLFRCSGDLDKIMKVIAEQVSELVEINLERLQVSDTGLTAISKCSILEILHLMETPKCTNNGLNTVSQNCKLLRKLHIDGWKTNKISDDGLIVVAKHCPNITNLKPIFSYQDFLN